MNFTNSTCTSAGSSNKQEPVPVWVCVVLILLNMLILIGTLIGFSCLLRFIVTSKKKDRTPGHAFFFGISMASLLGSLIGIPFSIYAAWIRFRDKLQTAVSHYVQSRILYLTFSLVFHYFSCITTERYIAITSKTRKISASTSKRVLYLITIYVIILWLIIILDDFCIYTPINCPSEIWQVLHNMQKDDICTTANLTSFQEPKPSRVALVVITIWMTACTIVTTTTTLMTLRFIKRSIKTAIQTLRKSANRFEGRRLKVLYAMSVFFSLLWVPYGVVVAQRINMHSQTYEILQTFLKTACYASFSVVPITVYVMDKRFSSFVKSAYEAYFRANKVSAAQPLHTH